MELLTKQRRIEEVGSPRNIRLKEGALVRHDRPRELVAALVLLRIRRRRTPQQRNTQHIPQARESILALRQNSHSVPILAQIRIFVSAHLELGDIPACVLVRRALYVSELSFVCRVVAVDVEWELDWTTVRTEAGQVRKRY